MTQDCDTCRNLSRCDSSCGGFLYEPKVLKIAFREFRKWLVRIIMDVFGEDNEDEDEDDEADEDYETDFDEDTDPEVSMTTNNTFVCPHCGRIVKIGEENYDDKKL